MEIANNRNMAYICIAGAGAALIASLIFQSPIFASLSAACFLLALSIWKYGYVIWPWFTSIAGISPGTAQARLTAPQDALVTRRGPSYFASVFLSVRLNDSSTDKDPPKRALLMEYFERAISSVRYPVKISLLISPLDTSAVSDELRAKRSAAEVHHARALSSGKSHLADAARLKRQISSIDAILSKLSSGEQPMDISAYIMASAQGASEQEAISMARSRAGEIKAAFGTALNAEITQLAGEELLRCILLEHALPNSQDALSGEFG